MSVNIQKYISNTVSNKNFSCISRVIDQAEEAPISKNTFSIYNTEDIEKDIPIKMSDDDKIDLVAARILKKYRRAFEELAK